MSVARESFRKARESVSVGFGIHHMEAARAMKGEVFIEVRDGATGELLHEEHKQNVITLDAGILAAMLFRDPASHNGANMLAVGTGATGPLLSPNAPSPLQRSLNSLAAMKAWAGPPIFRDANGFAVAYPTNIVDFTCTFTESEAVGPLNEMGIVATGPGGWNTNNPPAPRDPTIDVSNLNILVNYLTFAVINKPNTATLSITWRITF